MANEIKNKIVLEGEAEYKKELADINRSLKEHKSALKAASAEMDGAEDSMVAMYKQGDALERVIRDQENALRLMENQLGKVEQAYGKNSREATELRTKINNMRTELAGSRSQLSQFENKMDDAAQAMQGSISDAKKAGEAIENLGEQAQKATGDVGDLAGQMDGLKGVDVKSLIGTGGKAAIAAAIGAGVKEGLTIGNETLESWNQLAAYTGLTGDALERVKEDAQAVYQSGIGENLMDVSQATAAVYQLTGYTGASLQDCTKYAMALSDTFGMDVGESARTAAVLMEAFGISGKDAYDLITIGAQNGADKNGNLLDTINEYAPYFKNSGQSAEEFFTALITGAQNGIYDVDKIGDAWKEFTIRLTDGSDSTKEALEKLGFAADDITWKFAQGGPAADQAADDIIAALAKVEDPLERNQLGVALFGTQWEDTGGKVLPVFRNMESGLEGVQGAAQKLADVKYDDLDTAWNNLARSLEALAQPALTAGAEKLADLMNRTASAVDAAAAGDWKGAAQILTAPSEEEVARVETMRSASAELREELAALDEQIDNAFMSGDNATGWTLTAQRQQLLDAIAQAEIDALEKMTAMGENMATELEGTSSDMQAAGETVGDAAVSGVDGKQSDAQAAGESVGEAAVLGLEDGADGMEDAGSDAADGAVSGMRSGVNAAYNAGYATGKAYERGYRAATDTHSPSRVMEEAAHDTTAGALDAFKEDEARLYAAGAALGDAVREGYGAGSTLRGAAGLSGGSFVTAEELAQATVRALVEAGIGFYVSGEKLSELTAGGVSRKIVNDSQATIKGQGAASRGW